MDMMSNFDKLDILIGNEIINPVEIELAIVIGESTVKCDIESTPHPRENFPHETDEFRNPDRENNIPRRDGILKSKSL